MQTTTPKYTTAYLAALAAALAATTADTAQAITFQKNKIDAKYRAESEFQTRLRQESHTGQLNEAIAFQDFLGDTMQAALETLRAYALERMDASRAALNNIRPERLASAQDFFNQHAWIGTNAMAAEIWAKVDDQIINAEIIDQVPDLSE